MGESAHFLTPPEHWRNAEAFLKELEKIKGKYRELKISGKNETDQSLKGVPSLLHGEPGVTDEEMDELWHHYDAVDRFSAVGATVSVYIEGNEDRRIDLAGEDIIKLALTKGGGTIF